MSGHLEFSALLLHNLGYVFGTGGAVVIILLNTLIDRNPELAPHRMTLFPPIQRVIFTGLGLMLIVHTGELITETSVMHLAKGATIYTLLLIGIYQVLVVSTITGLAPKGGEKPSPRFLSRLGRARILGFILLALWFVDFALNTVSEPTHAFNFLA